MELKLEVRSIVSGKGEGEILFTRQPISFWGVVDPHSGDIIDPRHELFGHSIADRVVVFPQGKGSSTGSLIMLELVRLGRAPAAIINVETEPILATGPIVCRHFYGRHLPIVNTVPEELEEFTRWKRAAVDAELGVVTLRNLQHSSNTGDCDE